MSLVHTFKYKPQTCRPFMNHIHVMFYVLEVFFNSKIWTKVTVLHLSYFKSYFHFCHKNRDLKATAILKSTQLEKYWACVCLNRLLDHNVAEFKGHNFKVLHYSMNLMKMQ